MSRVLVDANVLLDVLTADATWFDWSARQLDLCAAPRVQASQGTLEIPVPPSKTLH